MNKTLSEILKGKVVLVGIGNPLRGDDGLGPAMIAEIKEHCRAVCLDAGSAPESYIGKIVKEKPDIVLLIDVAHLDREPGAYEILERTEIVKSGFTTHDMSPRMFIDFLSEETKAEIYMLAVEPQTIALGDEMSDVVKKTLHELSTLITEVLRA